MLQVLQNKSLDLLDTVVRTLESYEDNDKREKYFADRCIHRSHHETKETEEKTNDDAYPSLDHEGDDVSSDTEE